MSPQPHEIKLLKNGEELDDNKTLEQYAIRDGHRIEYTYRETGAVRPHQEGLLHYVLVYNRVTKERIMLALDSSLVSLDVEGLIASIQAYYL